MKKKPFLFALTVLLLYGAASRLWAQQVGETLAALGRPDYKRELPATDSGKLDIGDLVMLRDRLTTDGSARLTVLLTNARSLAIAPESKVVILRDKAELDVGTLKASGYEIVTLSARASPRATAFIVTCGPPFTPSNDDCLFVGVYGTTRVASRAFPDQPVFVTRKFFTRVRAGQLPTPPRPISESQFLELSDLTTIVGTGLRHDRLTAPDATTFPPPPWPGEDAKKQRRRSRDINLQDGLVDQPTSAREPELGQLPLPPPPPPKPPLPRQSTEK